MPLMSNQIHQQLAYYDSQGLDKIDTNAQDAKLSYQQTDGSITHQGKKEGNKKGRIPSSSFCRLYT